MGLQRNTIKKLLRESFPGTAPLVVEPAARKKLTDEVTAMLQRIDGVDTKDHAWVREEEKPRHVGAFSLIEPRAQPYYHSRDSFRLLLDEDNRLTIRDLGYSRGSALVGDLDEIVHFVRQCKERLERKRALEAKRGKVRDLLTQAILAQVRKVARAERFDFMSEADAQKLKLYVKLSDQQALELSIPFRDFKEILPQLRSTIPALRQLYQGGIRFHVVGRRSLPWRQQWVRHDSPEGKGPPEQDEV